MTNDRQAYHYPDGTGRRYGPMIAARRFGDCAVMDTETLNQSVMHRRQMAGRHPNFGIGILHLGE